MKLLVQCEKCGIIAQMVNGGMLGDMAEKMGMPNAIPPKWGTVMRHGQYSALCPPCLVVYDKMIDECQAAFWGNSSTEIISQPDIPSVAIDLD